MNLKIFDTDKCMSALDIYKSFLPHISSVALKSYRLNLKTEFSK